MQKLLGYSIIIIGLITGLFHLRFAVEGWFISRNNEPFTFWLFLFSGPLSTLPAVIVSFFWKKIGGIWLIAGALLSSAAWVFSPGAGEDNGDLLRFFLSYSIPMLVLGLSLLLLNYSKTSVDVP
ncbi:MAG: hypothetical protein ACE5GK_08010 [Nitrospiria bacterium]